MLEEFSQQIAEVMTALAGIADEAAAQSGTKFQPELKGLDSALYCLLGVFMPALDRWGRQHRDVIWRNGRQRRANPSFVFIGLLANVINSALAVRRLAVMGFDRQARAVLRELTEVGDLLLVITADEEFLDRYLESPEDFDQARAYWDKHLRPWRIRERVKAVAREVRFDDMWVDPAELWSSRWALYGWLSKSAHVDYAALVVEAMAADGHDRHSINVGGRIGSHSATTLRRLAEYLRDLLVLMALFLSSRHHWNRDDTELHEPLLVIRAFAEDYAALGRQRPEGSQVSL